MKWLLIVALVIAVPVLLIVVIGAMLPREHTATRSVLLPQSPEQVWASITAAPDWRPDIRSFQELPSHDGRRMWRETDRHGQTITYEAIESIPPQRLVVRIADPKLPFGGTWTYVIAAHPSGSSLTSRKTARSTIRCFASFPTSSWARLQPWMLTSRRYKPDQEKICKTTGASAFDSQRICRTRINPPIPRGATCGLA